MLSGGKVVVFFRRYVAIFCKNMAVSPKVLVRFFLSRSVPMTTKLEEGGGGVCLKGRTTEKNLFTTSRILYANTMVVGGGGVAAGEN